MQTSMYMYTIQGSNLKIEFYLWYPSKENLYLHTGVSTFEVYTVGVTVLEQAKLGDSLN